MAQPIFGNSFAPSILGKQPQTTTPPASTPAPAPTPGGASGFTPLTPQQYQAAQAAGFSPEQIIANEKTRQQQSSGTPAAQAGGPPGFFSKLGSDLASGSIGQEVIGMAKGIGQTAVGVGELGQQALGQTVGRLTNAAMRKGFTPTTTTSPGVKAKTDTALSPQGLWQGAGNILEKGAELLTPTPEINAAKDVMGGIDIAKGLEKIPAIGETLAKGVNAIKDIPALGKGLSYATEKVLKALPEAVFGTGYGLSQGQKPGEAVKTGATFGVLSGLGEVVGDTWRAIKGGVADNVNKALGMTNRKIPLSEVTKTMPQRLNAFQTMATMGTDLKVKTTDGVEKLWEPTKDGFYEGLQAFQGVKQKVFNAYTELAKQAGDKGSQFLDTDFQAVEDALQGVQKNTTSSFVNKSKSLIEDLQRNFGHFSVDEEGKKVFEYYKDTSLKDIQDFIKNVNTDVNPVSDKAAAEVSDTASVSLRKQMEDKILNSTNKSWQKLRNTYRDLKAIEPDLMNQFRKVTRGSPGTIGKYVEGFGAIDTVLGFLEKNPAGMAKGALTATLGKTMNYLKDPTVGLQNAFKQLLNEGAGPLESRLLGGGGEPPANSVANPNPPGAAKPPTVSTAPALSKAVSGETPTFEEFKKAVGDKPNIKTLWQNFQDYNAKNTENTGENFEAWNAQSAKLKAKLPTK